MATTPIIQSTGSTSGAGVAGRGRNNLVLSETVTCSDTEAANSGASYVWTLVEKPQGSSTVMNSPTTATPDFVPDVVGSYKVKALVDGSFSSVEIFAVPLARTGARIPAFAEGLEYDESGNTKGWHQALDYFMRQTDALFAFLGSTNTFTGAQGSSPVALTDAANISVNASLGNSFQVTLEGNRTLDNPTNLVAGFTYLFRIKQDPTGTRTLAYGSAYKFEGGSAPTLSTAANAVDILTGYCPDGAILECSVLKDLK